MEQLATITRHSDYLNLFRIVSVRETLQHFDVLWPRLVIIKTLMVSLHSVTLAAGLLVFQMKVPGLSWAHPWLILLWKGLASSVSSLSGRQVTRPEQRKVQDKEAFNWDFSQDYCKEGRCLLYVQHRKLNILNISLPVFVQRGSLTLTIFLLSMIFSKSLV